jgi:hypothetical protein
MHHGGKGEGLNIHPDQHVCSKRGGRKRKEGKAEAYKAEAKERKGMKIVLFSSHILGLSRPQRMKG